MSSLLPWRRRRAQEATLQLANRTPADFAAQALKLWRLERVKAALPLAALAEIEAEQEEIDEFYRDAANRSDVARQITGFVGTPTAGDRDHVADVMLSVERAVGRLAGRIAELPLEGKAIETSASEPRSIKSLMADPIDDWQLRALLNELADAAAIARNKMPGRNCNQPSLVLVRSNKETSYASAVAELAALNPTSLRSEEFLIHESLMLAIHGQEAQPGADNTRLVDAYKYLRDQAQLLKRAPLSVKISDDQLPAIFDFVQRASASDDKSVLAIDDQWEKRTPFGYALTTASFLVGALGTSLGVVGPITTALGTRNAWSWTADLIIGGVGLASDGGFVACNWAEYSSNAKLADRKAAIRGKRILTQRFERDVEWLLEITSDNMARQCQADESLLTRALKGESLSRAERSAADRAQARLDAWGPAEQAQSSRRYGLLALDEAELHEDALLSDSELATSDEIRRLSREVAPRREWSQDVSGATLERRELPTAPDLWA